MNWTKPAPLLGATIIALASLLSACGGGGSGSGGGTLPTTNPGGGGNPGGGSSPTPASSATPPGGGTPTPAPTPTPAANGTMTLNGAALANATVAFTCGCTEEAGVLTTDGSGKYTIKVPATGLPSGSPAYTPPGHNLMVIGYAGGASHGQSWTMEFFGNTPAHDLNLSGTASTNVSDKFTTATALYVYYETIQYYLAHPSTDKTYDVWNFNNIIAFNQSIAASGGNNAAETKLIADISAAQQNGTSLYPAVPSWDKTSGDAVNAKIVADIKAVAQSSDAKLPQACGTSCAGAPVP
jgi:hypothetical protein